MQAHRAPVSSSHTLIAKLTRRSLITSTIVLVVIGLATLTSQSARAENWPGFRGLHLAGSRPDAQLPKSWDKQQYSWTKDLMTRDVGSMAIHNDRVYLLSIAPASPNIRLMAIDLKSGNLIWSKEFAHAKNHLHVRNTLASSTPATDDQHIYFAHSDRQHTWLRCLDHQGNEIWQRDFGIAQSQHGFGTSPTVHKDMVLLNFSQQSERLKNAKPETSRILALNRMTGETIWQTPLTSTRVCYGVPVIHGDQVIGANTGDGLFGLSLASGKMLWNLPVFRMRCVSTPIVFDSLAVGSSGSGGGGNHLVAVRIPESSEEKPTEVYRIEKSAPYVPTSVVNNGLMFIVSDDGKASCIDAKTGKSHWIKRLGGNYGASPVLLGDKVLVISLDGKATVFRASKKYEEISEVDLGGPVGATPAYADGRLILRVGTQLRCL